MINKVNKITVSIGIPAYNEAGNISKLIASILHQNSSNYRLDKIIVVSDGSTDKTISEVEKNKDNCILIIKNKKRTGKTACLNQIFKHTKSEVIVIFDADIFLNHNEVIKNLINPFIKNKDSALVYGDAKPFLPNNWVQRIAFAAWSVWRKTKQVAKNEMYNCEGTIRALSRNLYKVIKFPNTSTDDVYPYLFCKMKSLKVNFVKTALVNFILPATLNDYVNQMIRYLHSENSSEKSFDSDFINKFYTINSRQKIQGLFMNFIIDPAWTLIYLFFVPIIKIKQTLDKKESSAIWSIVTSSKNY